MLGRNHAAASAAAWVWLNNAVPVLPGAPGELTGPEVLVTAAVAAGAGVLPDLDHPGSTPAKAFGWVSKVVSKLVSVGGHRQITHSLGFAAAVAGVLWAGLNTDRWWDDPRAAQLGLGLALVFVFCTAAVGSVLIGPSLHVRVPMVVSWALGAGVVWWVLNTGDTAIGILPHVAAVGIVTHVITDGITHSGVPLLMPLTSARFSARLIRTGGTGEAVISVGLFLAAIWGVAVLI